MNKYIKIILISFLFISVSYAECIKGNCIDGFGSKKYEKANYIGEWKDGKRHGQGTLSYNDGSKYVGEYKEGKVHGQGTHTYADGSKYVGEWKDNKSNGQGTSTWANGDKYVGEWKDNNMEGNGTYTQSNGNIYHSGLWKANRPYKQPLSLEELAKKSNKKLEQALNCYRYIDDQYSKKLMRGHIDLLTKMEENMRLYPDSAAGPSEETYGNMIATSNTIIEIGGCRF